MTLVLGQPDSARARPSTVLSRKEGYESIFPEDLDRNAYLRAIELLKAVDDFLVSDEAKSVLDEFTNTRFYELAGYEILSLGVKVISDIRFDHNFRRLSLPLDEGVLMLALVTLDENARVFQDRHPKMSRDAIFKNSDFRDLYFAALMAKNE